MNVYLQRARSALAAGRPEEAAVHAWNAVANVKEDADREELLRLAVELNDELLLRELEDRGFSRPRPEQEQRPPRAERRAGKLRFLPFVLVLLVVTALVVSDLPTEGRPPDVDEDAVRERPEAHPRLLTLRSGVWLVPVERAETVDLERIAEELTFRYRIPVGVQARVTLTPSTLQESRDDPVAERLLDLLARAYVAESRATIIGVTDYDMNSPTHGHVFTLRSSSNYAIVSTAQLGATILDRARGHGRHERTRKLIARNMAFLHLGLPMVADERSLRRSTMSDIGDIDELEERF